MTLPVVTLPWPPILVITDRAQCAQTLEARAASLFQAGCRWLSLREKDLEPEARRALLHRLMAIGSSFGVLVSVHDDLPAAASCGSALHLPAGGDLAAARETLGTVAIIGQSCHDDAGLAAARNGGADYATLGPAFESQSKPGYRPLRAFAEIVRAGAAGLPVLALGGVGLATLPALAGSGIAGVAVMGEAMRTADPDGWFRRLAGNLVL